MDKWNGPIDLKKIMISCYGFIKIVVSTNCLVYIEKLHLLKKSFSLSFPVMT